MALLPAVVPGADGAPAETFKFITYIPYLILLIVIALLDVLALTCWKQRVFQMRTAILAALVTLKWKHNRWVVALAVLFMIAIFSIPHSAYGSEYDYNNQELSTER